MQGQGAGRKGEGGGGGGEFLAAKLSSSSDSKKKIHKVYHLTGLYRKRLYLYDPLLCSLKVLCLKIGRASCIPQEKLTTSSKGDCCFITSAHMQ